MYDERMKLSENFTLIEFTKSISAYKRRIENHACLSEKNLENLKALCRNVLQPLRDHFKEPVYISSGFRCAALNKVVGGAKKSQHMYGEAADIYSAKGANRTREWFLWMVDNLEFDQLIWEVRPYNKWIHVSFKSTGPNRQQVLTLYE